MRSKTPTTNSAMIICINRSGIEAIPASNDLLASKPARPAAKEEDRNKISSDIEKEQALITEQLEEMGIETSPDEMTPDVYEAMMYDLVEIETEDENDE